MAVQRKSKHRVQLVQVGPRCSNLARIGAGNHYWDLRGRRLPVVQAIAGVHRGPRGSQGVKRASSVHTMWRRSTGGDAIEHLTPRHVVLDLLSPRQRVGEPSRYGWSFGTPQASRLATFSGHPKKRFGRGAASRTRRASAYHTEDQRREGSSLARSQNPTPFP